MISIKGLDKAELLQALLYTKKLHTITPKVNDANADASIYMDVSGDYFDDVAFDIYCGCEGASWSAISQVVINNK